MAKLDILTVPDPILRKKAAPIERIDEALRRLAGDMLETMYEAPGVGLAAPQVGISRRLIVVDVGFPEEQDEDGEPDAPGGAEPGEAAAPKPVRRNPIVMINPEIIRLGDHLRLHEEGCLSIPDVRLDIERPAALTVSFLDLEGRRQELAADGLLATVVQHEVDHLNGRLIIDFLSRLKRDMIVRKLKKARKAEDVS